MKLALHLLALVVLVAACDACSCRPTTAPTTVQKEYYSPSTSRVVRAVVKSVRREPCPTGNFNCKVFYRIGVIKSFKGCAKPSTFEVSTPASSGLCGVSLSVGAEYLFFLTSDAVPSIFLCKFMPRFSDIFAAELKFLQRRYVCCDDQCACSRPYRMFNCYMAPCESAKPPCKEAASCRDNYCGGCRAEWFTKDGYPACSSS